MMPEFPGRLLGIDHGIKYLGFAICDRIGLIARPLMVWERKSKLEDFTFIQHLIHQEEAVAVVLGLPPRPPEFVGYSQQDTVKLWAQRLYAAIALPIYLWDEGFSSEDALERFAEIGQRAPERIDAHAAAVILQSFLEAIREGTPWPEPLSTG